MLGGGELLDEELDHIFILGGQSQSVVLCIHYAVGLERVRYVVIVAKKLLHKGQIVGSHGLKDQPVVTVHAALIQLRGRIRGRWLLT